MCLTAENKVHHQQVDGGSRSCLLLFVYMSRLDLRCSIIHRPPSSHRATVPLVLASSSTRLSVSQSPLRWFVPSSASWGDGCRSGALSGPPRLRRSPADPQREQNSFLNPVLFRSWLSQNISWKYLIVAPLCYPLLPSFLFGLLFGPGFVLDLILGKLTFVLRFQLCEHLLSLLLPVLILVADGVRVHRRLDEIGERFPLELGHLGQAEEGKATGQGAKVQI